ncbi:hypothetical protein [Virgibacillus halodenitrificans]|uniref:hypothetical protein n=1 Tax=Virgibacillus halodenitrificans TaxID=1482 RepID=UPI0002EEB619|nr:hypothetical protein [Virgibacillus halodenitrificans]
MNYKVVLKSGACYEFENVDYVDSVEDVTFLKRGKKILFFAQSENVEYILNI